MKPAWISFDCYGTLIDWETGLRQFFVRLLTKKRVPLPPDELMKSWEPFQFKLVQGPYRRYREILYRSLEQTLGHHKIAYTAQDGRDFAAAFASWRPFKDVREGLRELQKHCRIAIISNTDREFIGRSITHMGVTPDVVVIAEDVRAYKPSTRPFEEALRRMGAPAEQCIHAAFGVKYDLAPARALGFKTCLVRRGRLSAPVRPQPDFDVASIPHLADAIWWDSL